MDLLKKSKAPVFAVMIFSTAFFLRISRLDLPLVEPYNSITRQSIVASVARNFYDRGFNFFYPEIYENGRGPYLYNAEMPFGPYLMSMGYQLAGGVKEWVARSVSVFFSIGALLFITLLTRRLYGNTTALIASALTAFSPLNLAISRSLQPEAVFLCASLGALYFYLRYQSRRKMSDFWASSAWMFLAVASKFYNAYLLVLIAYLSWQKDGSKMLKDPKNYIYLFIACSSFAWYLWMWRIGQTVDLAYCPYRYISHAAGRLGNDPEIILTGSRLLACLKVFVFHLLSPLGFFFFLLGAFRKPKSPEDRFVRVWMGTTVLLMLIGWKTVMQHSYYQLPLLLPASIFVAWGTLRFYEKLKHSRFFFKFIFVVMIAAEIGSLTYLYKGLYVIPNERYAIVNAGKFIDHNVPKNNLVVASYETSPILLYYSGRRGWSFSFLGKRDEKLIEEIEKRREEGARYFTSATAWTLERYPIFYKYLAEHYTLVDQGDGYVVYDLKKRAVSVENSPSMGYTSPA